MICNDLTILHSAISSFNSDDRVSCIKSFQLLYRTTTRKDMKDIVLELARTFEIKHSLIINQKPQRIGVDLKSEAEELALDLLRPGSYDSMSELVRLVNRYREETQLELSAADFAVWNKSFSLTLHLGRKASASEAA
jgi:hypothetical protein